jgi:PAS domain S-box-containing protein
MIAATTSPSEGFSRVRLPRGERAAGESPPRGPRAGVREPGEAQAFADRERTSPSAGLRVLLVEDNPGDVDLVREALARADKSLVLVHVERISEAIERGRETAFDVVLLDLSLPDSFELAGARQLRAACPHLPIVVLTALDDDRVAASAVAEGAQDYLVKGQIEPSLLVRSMRYAIERQQYGERARLLAQEHSARLAAEAAERKLRESESRFRAVLDQVEDYAIFILDPEGRVASWSRGARLLKGWSQEEILGKSFALLYPPEAVARGTPDAELERAAREGHVESEGWRIRKDGSRFVANVVMTALRGEEGELLGFVKVTRDVTERRRAERSAEFLARAAEELTSSLDSKATLERLVHVVVPEVADWCGVEVEGEAGSTGAFVASAHVDPRIELALQESRRRFPLEERRPSEIVERLRRGEPVFFPQVGDAGLSDVARSAEHFELLRTVGPHSLVVVPLRSRGVAYGSVTLAMTGSSRRFDEADLQLAVELARRSELAIDNARLFEQAQRAVRVREDILAVVSHDLRTPLTAIKLAASVAARRVAADPQLSAVLRQLEAIGRRTVGAEVLLRDLLDMASIRAGRMTVRFAPEEVDGLLSEAMETHEPLAVEKGVSLEKGTPGAIAVRCDRARILQVFSNVLTNAIKFCAAGDQVRLGAEQGEGFATFTVADTGPGIAEDELPHVFEAYWSAHPQMRQGTGLGLFICKGIVEAHGGRIWIESQAGRGTTVRFAVPTVTG